MSFHMMRMRKLAKEPSHIGSADQVLLMSQLSVGPTRYRDVVLTSWDRGMSDYESINVGTVVITNGSDSVHLLVDIERGDIGHWT